MRGSLQGGASLLRKVVGVWEGMRALGLREGMSVSAWPLRAEAQVHGAGSTPCFIFTKPLAHRTPMTLELSLPFYLKGKCHPEGTA